VPPPAPPPRPPSAPTLPGIGLRPAVPPPSAPKPAVPAPAAGAPKAASDVKPISMKAAPKKETARIQVAPQTQKMPAQATVRLSQPASLSPGPAPAIRTTSAPVVEEAGAGADPIVTWLSIAAAVFALLAAAVTGYLAYGA